jgi:SNF2 family DNA or RNA helicase
VTTTIAWPAERMYFSERVYDFQADGIAEAYLMKRRMAVFDTGLGKTHLAMGTAGLAFEDGEIDLTLIIAEKNKIREWVADFKKFTRLEPVLYHGTGRERRLEKAHKAGKAQVVVSTYETIRNDCAAFLKNPGGRGIVIRDGKLMPFLRGRKILAVYDEMAKLGASRSSKLYKGHHYLLKELRKLDPDLRVLGLTATPISRDWENAFNELRLVEPGQMPTVTGFDDLMVRSRHPVYGTATWRTENIPAFVSLCEPLIIRKRKTDPDVIEEFPKQIEEVRQVEMGKAQRELYELVEGLAWDDAGNFQEVPGLYVALRQLAGHPASIIHSAANGSQIPQMLLEGLGEDFLRSVPSAKTEALLEYLRPLVLGQGAKVMVFTYFGQSVLRELARELSDAGIPMYLNHGGLTGKAQHDAIDAFRTSSGPGVLLSSDAGARGINVPEATYIVEYESALSYANRTQRMNRSHRIDSTAASVHCMTFVLDGTVEETIVSSMLARNEATDTLLGDTDAGEDFVSAGDRRRLFSMARARR